MIVIGLTGSIGMGKSTTAGLFREAGVPVHDSDLVVHRLYSGPAAPLIESAFPGVAPGGKVDRPRLAERVLGDEAAMKRLEAIVHPMVDADRRTFLADARARGVPFVVLDVPLLFEIGFERYVDLVLVVAAEKSVQKSRVLARPGMTLQRFEAIVAKQVPDADKRKRAHIVIDSGRGIAFARNQVRALLRALAASANG